MKLETRGDFLLAQRLGVSGFPTLAMHHGERLHLVANGFTRTHILSQRVAQIAASPAAGQMPDDRP